MPQGIFALANINPRRLALVLAIGILGAAALTWLAFSLVNIVSRGSALRCPMCRSQRIRPSWPRIVDRFLPMLQPFRCEACLKRFYLFGRMRKFRAANAS